MLNANAKFTVTKNFMLGKERIQVLKFFDKVNIFLGENMDFKPFPVLSTGKHLLTLRPQTGKLFKNIKNLFFLNLKSLIYNINFFRKEQQVQCRIQTKTVPYLFCS